PRCRPVHAGRPDPADAGIRRQPLRAAGFTQAMSKLLFWVAIILVGLLAMRLMARHAAAKRPGKSATPRRPGRSKRIEPMVQCAHCGVHLPATEAYRASGQDWCSAEHARLGRS